MPLLRGEEVLGTGVPAVEGRRSAGSRPGHLAMCKVREMNEDEERPVSGAVPYHQAYPLREVEVDFSDPREALIQLNKLIRRYGLRFTHKVADWGKYKVRISSRAEDAWFEDELRRH